MSLYQNKYRIESARLKEWDYKNAGWYYVTVCTKNHISWFGKVINCKMILNKLGKIVAREWRQTESIRKNIELDYFVVMPNHIHGILIINHVETTGSVVSHQKNSETIHRIVSTTLQPDSLGAVIGQIKSVCTKQIRSLGYKNFAWQPRFYERIIRNEKELYKIRNYIYQNPLRRELEKEMPENIDL